MYRFGFLAAAVSIIAALGLAGCASAPRIAAEDAASFSSEAPDYLIGPGDTLEIFVWDHADLTTSVVVRPDGKISSRLVQDLPAAGLTATQLGDAIEEALKAYVVEPVVSVSVQSFVGDPAQQVRVVGQAAQPQALQYRQGMTVLDVLIEVGGLSEFAAGNRARIMRVVNGTPTEIRVRLDDLQNKGDIRQNVRMLPGDVLVIPESIF